MSDHDQSPEKLLEELALMRQKVSQLETTQTAFDIQNELVACFLTMMRTASGSLMLKAMLQEALKIFTRLTNAEESSLFLLDINGRVIESILARVPVIKEQKETLIGQVLEHGLAGWVSRNYQPGLVTDTFTDERWISLPNEPYNTRSALCVPILKGRALVGIVTLMHSQPNHFSLENARLMQLAVDKFSMIIENLKWYAERQRSQLDLQKTNLSLIKEVPVNQNKTSESNYLSGLGVYIIENNKFVYTNDRLAEIFGYPLVELFSLGSILDLVTTHHRDFVVEQIDHCLSSKSNNLYCIFQGQKKEGQTINVEIYGNRTKFYGKVVLIGVVKA